MKIICVRGGPNQPLHRHLQWSIVLMKSNSMVEEQGKQVVRKKGACCLFSVVEIDYL
jgi:hypothetical protein